MITSKSDCKKILSSAICSGTADYSKTGLKTHTPCRQALLETKLRL